MNLIERYNRLSFWNKISFWGAICSIVGLMLFILLKDGRKGNIKIVDSPGTTVQSMVDSPDGTQIINQIRKIDKKYTIKKDISANGIHLTRIILTQTKGIWNPGEIFKIQVELSGPFKDYKFIGGFPSGKQDVKDIRQETLFYFETVTPPLNEPIILQIESNQDINIKNLIVYPIDENT